MEKQITIQGTNNKYQMKKLEKLEKVVKKRQAMKDVDPSQFEIEDQLKYLPDASAEISKKLSSYKQQDIRKELYDTKKFITMDKTMEILKECNLSCYYCKNKIYVMYSDVREKLQWTLDRIDNKQGHNSDNVLIACLACNLKRKNCNKDSFLFTKQLTIVKREGENNLHGNHPNI
jgi:hypothetical protein